MTLTRTTWHAKRHVVSLFRSFCRQCSLTESRHFCMLYIPFMCHMEHLTSNRKQKNKKDRGGGGGGGGGDEEEEEEEDDDDDVVVGWLLNVPATC